MKPTLVYNYFTFSVSQTPFFFYLSSFFFKFITTLSIICPEEPYDKRVPNIWAIMSKVRFEAFLWGAGTALGELPPYFMAKAARLSGYDPDDAEELAEFEALKAKKNQKNLSLMDRGKLFMERVVERIGFFGILACASVS